MEKDIFVTLSALGDTINDPQILVENLDLFEKAHSKLHGLLISARMEKIMLDFGQRETDIYVVAFPRSGTTLLQMMLYQMTTDGDMGFNHIYDVSPWCRYAAIYNRPMKSVGKHRIIKSHDPYDMLAKIKKGKFIFLIRDCLDAVSSIYHQTMDYVDPTIDFNQLSERNIRRWFDYNVEWLENNHDLNMLILHYEDLVSKKVATINAISRFIGVSMGDKTLERVLDTTSYDFMKKHESKFGEQPEDWKVYNNFIRKGKTGEGKDHFNERQLQTYHTLSKKYQIKNTPMERYFKETPSENTGKTP